MTLPSLTTGQIAELVNADLQGRDDVVIVRLSGLHEAVAGDLCFIRSSEFADQWKNSNASAALVTRDVEVTPRPDTTLLIVDDADRAMIMLLDRVAATQTKIQVGVHPTAIVDPSAVIAPDAYIGPHCVIGAGVTIAAGAQLMSRVCVGNECTIGEATVFHPGVVLYDRTVIGERCLLHGNVVIGADGFGFRPDPSGTGLIKVPHIGHVDIGDDVEIGAGSCVDRGKFGATTIGTGTKIDNLVQIGHNCAIGAHCVICGHSGIGGSTTLGGGVTLGGKVGLPDNLTVGAGATLGGGSLAHEDIPPGEVWIGVPAQRARDAMACHAVFRKLPQLSRTVKKLAKQLENTP